MTAMTDKPPPIEPPLRQRPHKPKKNVIFRIDEDLYTEAKALADAQGHYITNEVERFLFRYVARNRAKTRKD